MDSNVYRAPESSVGTVEAPAPARGDAQFYVVSSPKFLLLFFATLGMYQVYWFYKNWSLYARASGAKLWPAARAFFAIFFAHALFGLFDGEARRRDATYRWSAATLALLYVVFRIVENVSDRLAWKEMGSPHTDIVALVSLLPIGWILVQAQKAANIACDDPDGETNSKLTRPNYFWVILGVLLWLLVGVGLYDTIVGLPK